MKRTCVCVGGCFLLTLLSTALLFSSDFSDPPPSAVSGTSSLTSSHYALPSDDTTPEHGSLASRRSSLSIALAHYIDHPDSKDLSISKILSEAELPITKEGIKELQEALSQETYPELLAFISAVRRNTSNLEIMLTRPLQKGPLPSCVCICHYMVHKKEGKKDFGLKLSYSKQAGKRQIKISSVSSYCSLKTTLQNVASLLRRPLLSINHQNIDMLSKKEIRDLLKTECSSILLKFACLPTCPQVIDEATSL